MKVVVVEEFIKFIRFSAVLFGGIASPLVGVKGEDNPIPYIIIIIATAVILIILQIYNMKVFKTNR